MRRCDGPRETCVEQKCLKMETHGVADSEK